MDIIDTQILSYVYKHKNRKYRHFKLNPLDHQINSIVAKEFLEIYSDKRTSDNYYLPVSKKSVQYDGMIHYIRKRNQSFNRINTDQFVYDFGNNYQALIDFGNIAISRILNQPSPGIFYAAIACLEKNKRKRVKRRFDFLLNQKIIVVPLTLESVKVGTYVGT